MKRQIFSKVLCVVALYRKCASALTFENVCVFVREKAKTLIELLSIFSKVLCVVALYRKCASALTFENV